MTTGQRIIEVRFEVSTSREMRTFKFSIRKPEDYHVFKTLDRIRQREVG